MHLYLIHQEEHRAIGVVEQKMKEVVKFLICEEWLNYDILNCNDVSLADKLSIEKTNIRGLLDEFETYSDETIKIILEEFGFSVEKVTLWNSVEWFHNNTP